MGEMRKEASAMEAQQKAIQEEKAQLRAQFGKNKRITGNHYDKALAVRCVNGTFVGRKTENIIAYRGIPFVGKQPVGKLRWKAPVDFGADDGVYEAYHNAKSAYGNEDLETGSLFYQETELTYATRGRNESTAKMDMEASMELEGRFTIAQKRSIHGQNSAISRRIASKVAEMAVDACLTS